MEFSRKQFRTMILYDFLCGLTQQQCINRLHLAVGDKAPYNATVYNWFAEFNRGRASVSDKFREGRPKTAVVPQNIDAVRELIMQDCHVTYREIEASVGINMKQIHEILHEHLA